MVNWMFVGCLGSINTIPTPIVPTRPAAAPPEITELVLRAELFKLEDDWESCEQALNQALYYAPRDIYLLIRAAEMAYTMDEKSASHQYLVRAMPHLIQQQKLTDPVVLERLQSLREE